MRGRVPGLRRILPKLGGMMDASAALDERLRYIGALPHAQRSILLLTAAIIVQHPRGAGIIREIQQHRPDLDRQQLCTQTLLDVMISISGDWNSASGILLPVATLIEQAMMRSTEGNEAICPVLLAGQLWELIESLHETPEIKTPFAARPSDN